MRRPQQRKTERPRTPQRGFSLLEVLVALVIIGVGMLGIAKIQALAYASTGTASERSLAAIEAASLAASMRANRGYWTVAPTPLTITVTGTVLASTDGTLIGAYNCISGSGPTPCAKNVLAGYDLQQWVTALNALLPNVTGTISCPTPAAASPIACTIQISWSERYTAINSQSAGNTMAAPTYTLYVEP